jgi:small GTP-binding protein
MEEDPIGIKCVLLGESCTGKSSLIERFINNTFRKDTPSTLIGSFSSKVVYYEKENIKIRYDIWDTAGQEKYRSINKIFYQDAQVTLLVYDITQKETYDAIKNYWFQEVKDNAPEDVIVFIVGNKSDIYEKEAVNEEEARQYAKDINALYKLVSAENGDGINEIFKMIGERMLTQEFLEKIKNEKNNNDNNNTNNNKNTIKNISIEDNKGQKKKKKCC